MITAFLTATYMFRLLYLAFFGERRAVTTPDGETAEPRGPQALHDAPPAMAIVLVVLAIGSIVAGYVGVPNVLVRGGNRIEAFLEPSFRAPDYAVRSDAGRADSEAPAVEAGSTEMGLMALSTIVALAGIGVATTIYLRRPGTAERLAARFSGLYKLLLGKYFVDELYDETIVQPIKRTSTFLLWRGVDAGVIDGTVNGVGLVVRGWSAMLRRLQTGSVRAYAMSLFVGVVMILGYYLWR